MPACDLPVFNAGGRAQCAAHGGATARGLPRYRKAIQTAFREVSDSLVGYRKNREQRAQEELLVKALRETSALDAALSGRARQLSAGAGRGAQSVSGRAGAGAIAAQEL